MMSLEPIIMWWERFKEAAAVFVLMMTGDYEIHVPEYDEEEEA